MASLANTYARPLRGPIKQIKDQLRKTSKGSQSIFEYMLAIKTKSDQLATLGKPLDHEDLIEKILEGLDDDYQLVFDAINGQDAPILFDELHEKLINKELALRQKNNSLPLQTTANPTNGRSNGSNNKNHLPRPSWNPSVKQPRWKLHSPTCLGHYQWCRT